MLLPAGGIVKHLLGCAKLHCRLLSSGADPCLLSSRLLPAVLCRYYDEVMMRNEFDTLKAKAAAA